MRILIVDDDQHARQFAVRAFERANHEVRTAADGAGLGELLQSYRPDLVIVDLFMPNVDGFESLAMLNTQAPDVAVLVVSGGSPQIGFDSLPMAANLGADAVLAKPYTVDELLSAADEAVKARQSRKK